MDTVLTYQEEVTPLLTELRDYVAQHPDTVLFCTNSQPLPGLPLIPESAERVYRNYCNYVQTRWGLASYADIHYHHYPRLSYVGLHTLVEAAENVILPVGSIPEPGTAVINPITGFCAVYAGDGRDQDVAATPPVWEGRIPLPGRWYAHEVLLQVRLALAQAGVPVYPRALFSQRVAYPWLTPEGLPAETAYIANGQVRVPIIGYVIDPDTDEVIYLNLVGHKTAARSIWGSLNTMHLRKLTLDAPHLHTTVISSHTYATYTAVVDADTGLLRMQIVDRRAFASDVEDRAYLVAPTGLGTAAVDTAFAVRLSAVLPVGIPAAWGSKLREVGDDLGLVCQCLSGGDVGSAYTFTADEQWLDLVAGLLKSDPQFTIPKTLG